MGSKLNMESIATYFPFIEYFHKSQSITENIYFLIITHPKNTYFFFTQHR